MSKKSQQNSDTVVDIPPFPLTGNDEVIEAEVVEDEQESAVEPTNAALPPLPILDASDSMDTTNNVESIQSGYSGEQDLLTTIPASWELNTSADIPAVFFVNDADKVLATVALDTEFLEQFVPIVNEFYIVPEDEPPTWVLRIPDVPDPSPVFSLMRKGKIIGSVPLLEDDLETMLPILNGFYKKPVKNPLTRGQRFAQWMKKHKFLTGLIILTLLPVAAALLWGVFVQIQISFS